MIQPFEMKQDLPVSLVNNKLSRTTIVWDILVASKAGNLHRVKEHVAHCDELAYAQYNYMPPIHLAVREGHAELVKFLLDKGALSPSYTTYPFNDSLLTIAEERGYTSIVQLLQEYLADPSRSRFTGDCGEIHYNRSAIESEFEKAVDKEDITTIQRLLKEHPALALDPGYFWGEGILLFAAKHNNREMINLLMSHGATVPTVLKWTQFYYFERLDGAAYMMEKGMNPNTMNWHHVTLLHDMAQKGYIDKAELLLRYGAAIDPIDEEYQSTPLGMAARWGHLEMVDFLLTQGADPHKSGADWSKPLAWAQSKGHKLIATRLQEAGAS